MNKKLPEACPLLFHYSLNTSSHRRFELWMEKVGGNWSALWWDCGEKNIEDRVNWMRNFSECPSLWVHQTFVECQKERASPANREEFNLLGQPDNLKLPLNLQRKQRAPRKSQGWVKMPQIIKHLLRRFILHQIYLHNFPFQSNVAVCSFRFPLSPKKPPPGSQFFFLDYKKLRHPSFHFLFIPPRKNGTKIRRWFAEIA
jgi:hypothetical protein